MKEIGLIIFEFFQFLKFLRNKITKYKTKNKRIENLNKNDDQIFGSNEKKKFNISEQQEYWESV